jgi:hypothetical protein
VWARSTQLAATFSEITPHTGIHSASPGTAHLSLGIDDYGASPVPQSGNKVSGAGVISLNALRKETMAIGPVSEHSSNVGFSAQGEPEVRQSQPQTAMASVGTANVLPGDQTAAARRAASLESLAESFGSSGGPNSPHSEFDPSTIQESAISAALRTLPAGSATRPPIKNPQPVNAGSALHPNLQANPNIEPKGPIAQAAADLLSQAARSLRRASAPVAHLASKVTPQNPRQMTINPKQADARIREQEVVKRDRQLDSLQDNAADREARRKVRGGTRE